MLAGSVALATASAAPAMARDAAAGAPLRFKHPREELETIIRIHGNLQPLQAPWWYTGYIYGMRPGEAPVKLVKFEGCEINLFNSLGDGSYAQTGRTTSFFRDLQTDDYLDRWTNPYTGREVAVKANVLGGRGRSVWSEEGVDPQFRMGAASPPPASATPQPLHANWTAFGPWVWLRHDRVYPPGLPQPLSESTSVMFERRHVAERRRSAIPAFFSSTYMVGYPLWMDMKDQPGHAIWHADGIKLGTVDELPPAFLERMQRMHPQQLKVGS